MQTESLRFTLSSGTLLWNYTDKFYRGKKFMKLLQKTLELLSRLLTTTGSLHLKMSGGDFPGGPVVKNLPYNGGDTGSIPGQGTKIPHAAGQQSLCAANYRAHALWSLCATTREEKTRTPQLYRSLRTTMKSPCAATKDPATKTRSSQK